MMTYGELLSVILKLAQNLSHFWTVGAVKESDKCKKKNGVQKTREINERFVLLAPNNLFIIS